MTPPAVRRRFENVVDGLSNTAQFSHHELVPDAVDFADLRANDAFPLVVRRERCDVQQLLGAPALVHKIEALRQPSWQLDAASTLVGEVEVGHDPPSEVLPHVGHLFLLAVGVLLLAEGGHSLGVLLFLIPPLGVQLVDAPFSREQVLAGLTSLDLTFEFHQVDLAGDGCGDGNILKLICPLEEWNVLVHALDMLLKTLLRRQEFLAVPADFFSLHFLITTIMRFGRLQKVSDFKFCQLQISDFVSITKKQINVYKMKSLYNLSRFPK